ncbi:hypothetical protein J2W76_003509 [Methylorubrum zatmanii]|nr:hypothetical protein [Methylorubrum zatmanii]MCP1580567.1 hypothetical protein [Methylorubrum extorquens]
MTHDQVMLGIDRSLDVVADQAGALAAGRHGARVGIGQRDLAVGCSLDLPAPRLENQSGPCVPAPDGSIFFKKAKDMTNLGFGAATGRTVTHGVIQASVWYRHEGWDVGEWKTGMGLRAGVASTLKRLA